MKEKIASWIKRQIKEAGAKGIVLGLSGGIDSAVAAALSKEAVGRSRVMALLMPCESSAQDLKDAKEVAKKLGIQTKRVDLTALYTGFRKILPGANKLALVNLKPRLRMAVLYYFANKLNYLVCGTGNKSELMAGYFTKFGDGGADILPIGDLLKKQVRDLAQELGVPGRIIIKPPTAGLWLGQTDEGEMGITYAQLDSILEHFEAKKRQVMPKGKVAKVQRMIEGTAHKRQGPKICYLKNKLNS